MCSTDDSKSQSDSGTYSPNVNQQIRFAGPSSEHSACYSQLWEGRSAVKRSRIHEAKRRWRRMMVLKWFRLVPPNPQRTHAWKHTTPVWQQALFGTSNHSGTKSNPLPTWSSLERSQKISVYSNYSCFKNMWSLMLYLFKFIPILTDHNIDCSNNCLASALEWTTTRAWDVSNISSSESLNDRSIPQPLWIDSQEDLCHMRYLRPWVFLNGLHPVCISPLLSQAYVAPPVICFKF